MQVGGMVIVMEMVLGGVRMSAERASTPDGSGSGVSGGGGGGGVCLERVGVGVVDARWPWLSLSWSRGGFLSLVVSMRSRLLMDFVCVWDSLAHPSLTFSRGCQSCRFLTGCLKGFDTAYSN